MSHAPAKVACFTVVKNVAGHGCTKGGPEECSLPDNAPAVLRTICVRLQLNLVPGRKGLRNALGDVPSWVAFQDKEKVEVCPRPLAMQYTEPPKCSWWH